MRGKFLPVAGKEASLRDGFHRIANARENPQALAEAREWIESLLIATVKSPLPPFYKGGLAPPQPCPANAGVIAFHAPLALLEGAWLQSVALAANGHKEPVSKLFACYLALLGKDESDSPAFAYRAWLNLCQISLPQASAWRFAHDPRIGASALHFSSLQLALGWHSASFFPETLGFTLAYLHSESPWRLASLPAHKRNDLLASMGKKVEDTLRTFPSSGREWEKVCAGYTLYQISEGNYLDDLQTFAQAQTSLAGQAAEIFRRKLRFARGYHASVKLGGRELEEWFAGEPFDAAGFLNAFAFSGYAKGETGRRGFDQLTGFGGPMFGVFDREELDLINAWLDGVALGHNVASRGSHTTQQAPALNVADTAVHRQMDCQQPSDRGVTPTVETSIWPPAIPAGTTGKNHHSTALPFFDHTDKRSLFNLLINQDAQATTLATAQQRVERVLSRTRRGNAPLGKRIFDYAPQTLAQHIAQLHAKEVAKHQPFKPPPTLRREEYIWGIRQFAPTILIDGCWLQHMGEAAGQACRTQRLLYRIYAEELGDGIIARNHPKIYRDLLAGLGIDLAAVDSLAFADDLGFLDSAFDLPSYLLSISLYPKTYFPEILGLNLAIELSGLGVGYMRLAEELRHWNIDPLIVSLHLSIDNLAGGHAAMACEAVQAYLDGMLPVGGAALQDLMWRRVWDGYLSLDTATRRFKRALLLGFGRHFLPQRLLSALGACGFSR